jgi:BirA family biotin operon repressor/biotin-[acetyl-CoA-carboxylase] ligase
VVRLDAVDSTNDEALALAAAGAAEGTVVLARRQLRGRGRQGRCWHAPPGGGLTFSVVLWPALPRAAWPDLSWVLAAAVAEACVAAGAAGVRIKYPNDVYAGERKLAGLLLETRSGAGAPAALVAGIGVNVNTGETEFPAEVRGRAASLRMLTGRAHDPEALARELFGRLERWYGVWREEGPPGARRRLAEAGIGFWGEGGGALEERGPDAVQGD